MINEEINLLIHHHSVAFERNGQVWVPYSLGVWIDELSNYFNKIGLLLFTSFIKKPVQGYCLKNKNIFLHSLGEEGESNRIIRNLTVRSVCRMVSRNYNCLVIRGITPRQFLVYNSCLIDFKIYYFVGSLFDSKPKPRVSWIYIVQRFMFHFRRLQLRFIFHGSYVLSNSPATVSEIKLKYGKSALFAPSNTLKANDYSYKPYKIPQATVKLLFCGRLDPDKGIELLILAVKKLKEKNISCHLKVIGTGLPKYQQYLNKILVDETLMDSISFLGFIEFGDNLLNYYREADIFVLPTFHEGFPRAIWEASACCTPVLTTKVGGIGGLVTDSEVFFVPPNSPLAISEAIEFIIHNPDIAAKKVNLAYRLSFKHTAENCAEIFSKWINMYHTHTFKTEF